jgi:hypothetical protein
MAPSWTSARTSTRIEAAAFFDPEWRRKVGPLPLLLLLTQLRDSLYLEELRLVREARSSGATWEAIGDALGVPRQTAHRRFAAIIETVDPDLFET